ncbi:MAG: transposase [Rickettsia endosymbiont of Bryobia graminum]|nr:transposase [Rickettsia endosymbiont of Bryobia graminum]
MRKGNIRYIINRYHIVWITKYRYKVFNGIRLRR